jgi:hypothetical protein
VAGAQPKSPRYRFICQVPEGQFNDERRAAMTGALTQAVAEAEDGAYPHPEHRVCVFTLEVPDPSGLTTRTASRRARLQRRRSAGSPSWAAPALPPCAATPTAPACNSRWRAISVSSPKGPRSGCWKCAAQPPIAVRGARRAIDAAWHRGPRKASAQAGSGRADPLPRLSGLQGGRPGDARRPQPTMARALGQSVSLRQVTVH